MPTDARPVTVKMVAAILGGSALAAMCIIAATAGAETNDDTGIVSGGKMSLGETTTQTFSGTRAPIVFAVPQISAPPFGGNGGA